LANGIDEKLKENNANAQDGSSSKEMGTIPGMGLIHPTSIGDLLK
jgi:hypothetical protein